MSAQLSFWLKEMAPGYQPGANDATDSAVSAPAIVPQLAVDSTAIDQAAEGWKSLITPAQLARINGRLERGVALAKAGAVHFTFEPNVFKVHSASVKGNYFYWVNLGENPRTCTCPDYSDAPYHVCKHIVAAHLTKKACELEPHPEPEQPEAPAALDELPNAGAPAFDHDLLNNQVLDQVAGEAIAAMQPKPETFIYGWLDWTDAAAGCGQLIPVQIEAIENGQVSVRALPVIEGDEIRPIFPFTSPLGGNVCYSTATVPNDLLYNVKVYRMVRHEPDC